MAETHEFGDLIAGVRRKDLSAAEELVRRYEPMVRRVVRLRLQHSSLQRHVDSVDICQSVLGSFFVRAALGEYDLEQPEQLVRLLAAMARNKLADQGRRLQGKPRDPVAAPQREAALDDAADGGPSPSRVVAGRDLLQAVRAQMNEDENALADRRAEGCTWEAIAAERGETAEALRKRLGRALDRVVAALGLEDS
jgi:RNA polymerase sigma-70 factor (ECF subfamily)